MRHFLLAAALLAPSLSWAEDAPAFPECLIMPPNAEIVSAEKGSDATAFHLRFVLKVEDRLAAFKAVRAEVEARNKATPEKLYFYAFMDSQARYNCDDETIGIFETVLEPGPGEAVYLVGPMNMGG